MSTFRHRAIVTGATRGIGCAVVQQLVAQGIPVALVARNSEDLAEQVKVIRQHGGEASAYPIDLSDIAHLPALLNALLADFGNPSILINNAGMGYTGSLSETPLSDWQQVLNLNLTAALACIQAVLPGMRQGQQGTIINVVSIAGKQVFPTWGAYCASKFALLALSRTLALEEHQHGIRVTAVCPGAVATPLWDSPTVHAEMDRSRMLSADTVATAILQAILLPPEAVMEELVLLPTAGVL